MRLRPMQEDRDAGDRDVREHQRDNDVAPPRQGISPCAAKERKSMACRSGGTGAEGGPQPIAGLNLDRAIIHRVPGRTGIPAGARTNPSVGGKPEAAKRRRTAYPVSSRYLARLPRGLPQRSRSLATGRANNTVFPRRERMRMPRALKAAQIRRLIALFRLSWPFARSLIQSPFEIDAVLGEADDKRFRPAGRGPHRGSARVARRPSVRARGSTSLSSSPAPGCRCALRLFEYEWFSTVVVASVSFGTIASTRRGCARRRSAR